LRFIWSYYNCSKSK